MSSGHVIELNGKRYDTVTGKVITSTPQRSKTTAKPIVKTTKLMDGFARVRSQPKPQQHSGRGVQRSQTLMRTVVKKPAQPQSEATLTKHHTPVQPSPRKLAQAQQIAKSNLVKHFNHTATPKRAPATPPAISTSPHRVQAVATATTVKSDPISRGLANATAHEQVKPKKVRAHARIANRLKISPRIVSAGALGIAIVILGGFFAYQNIPNLNMRLASSRSGVNGSLPGYAPAGFSLRPAVSYSPGQVSINYKSNSSDNRQFTIHQSVSGWNSEVLHDNLLHDQNVSNPITIADNGKTVFIWDSNAAWVDGGILYKVLGDSHLSSDQLLRIVNSF